MFSGIVEEIGEVESFRHGRLQIIATQVLRDLTISDSICISGACLTVVERNVDGFSVDVVAETLKRTNFGMLRPGHKVNLERALKYEGRVGGHLLQGHIDVVAETIRITDNENSTIIWFKAAPRIMRYVVEKGFVAINGVSLTVVDRDVQSFSIAMIPYTREHTNLGSIITTDSVNIEVDITAKYIEQLINPHCLDHSDSC